MPRSCPRPRRGISPEKPSAYPGFFRPVHDGRRRGKALLGTLLGLVAPINPYYSETQ